MELASLCEVLQGSQQADQAVRKAAEQKIEEAKEGNPSKLVEVLCAVLNEGGNVALELRQEAAVILRQCVIAKGDELEDSSCKVMKAQLLKSVEADPSNVVRRNAGQVVVAIAQIEDSLEEQQSAWPELWPWIARLTGGEAELASRVVALTVLKELVPGVGDELVQKGDHIKQTLQRSLIDGAAEVRAAGAQLVLTFVRHLESEFLEQVAPAMPVVISVIQALADSSTEKECEETLAALVAAAEAEPDFFFEHNMKELWETLMRICHADKATFGTEELRHTAMEAAMSIAEGCNEEDGFKVYLESLVEINFKWMLELEADVNLWTAEGKDDDDDDCDDDTVRIGEENFDRLATYFEDDDLMPIMFKVITAATQNPQCTWQCLHSSIMAISQVMEHLEDEARVDQGIDFIMRHYGNQHPRVRYAAFTATGQTAYDQSDMVQAKHDENLIPLILKGIKDENVRVATAAVEAYSAVADEMDGEELNPFLEETLTCLFQHLQSGSSRVLQEKCVDAIDTIASSADEHFGPYYGQVMPLLKQLIINATSDQQRTLRGKAFECASDLGKVVGKEVFLKDACELMDAMLPMFQAGFAADDKMRESAHEAAGNIASTIGKDFKGYVGALLPTVFAVLQQKPQDINELLEEDDDIDQVVLNELGGAGLKTSVLEEMDEALELIKALAKNLEEEFCEFLMPTCQALLPMLDLPLSEDVRETILSTWSQLASCSRCAVEKSKLDPTILREMLGEFLKKAVGQLANVNPPDVSENNVTTCAMMHTVAKGASEVIQKSGQGVLTKEAMEDVVRVVGQLLDKIVADDASIDGKAKKKQVSDVMDEDDSDEEDDSNDPAPHSVRFALVDIMVSLMRANRDDFAQQALPSFMQLVHKLVQPSGNCSDRSLGFYIASSAIDVMEDISVQYWQGFMNEALLSVADTSPTVQRYATKVIGCGARYKAYSVMVCAAAQAVFQVLQKHGEKHRRRRVKKDQKPVALAIDACVEALGQICEHNEQALGEHAGRAWTMWLHSLPLKYDHEAGRKVHAQLLRLLAREHPAFVSVEGNLSLVLKVLADVYKTKFSTPDLDKDIAFAVSQIGQEKLEVLCRGFKEVQKNKTEQMLKNAKAAGGA